MVGSLVSQTIAANTDGSSKKTYTDYAGVTEKCEVTTERFDTPGKMTFSIIDAQGIGLTYGNVVELTVDQVKMFHGYIFEIEQTLDGKQNFTAYDQLRYLKANASYVFSNMSLEQIIRRIAEDFGLQVGELAETGYTFPCLIKENEECLSIIFDALSQTIIQTGKIFVFYDDFGKLTLREIKDRYINTLLGEKSLVNDFTFKGSISDSYNRIKLVRKNEETGRTDAYVYEDTDTQRQWGLLQYYDEVDENLNDAQIQEMCRAYLKYYNRVMKTIDIDAIGVPELRAGMIIPVQIQAIQELSMTRLLVTEKVTQTFSGEDHTMTITVKSFDDFGGGISIA